MTAETAGRRRQAALQLKDKEDYDAGLAKLLSDAQGRRFVWLFALSLGYDTTPLSGDASHTHYLVGRKSAAEDLIREIRDEHPEAYLKLIKEQQNAARERTEYAERLTARDTAEQRSAYESDPEFNWTD